MHTRRYSSDPNNPEYRATSDEELRPERAQITKSNATTTPLSSHAATEVEREYIVERSATVVQSNDVVRLEPDQRRYSIIWILFDRPAVRT